MSPVGDGGSHGPHEPQAGVEAVRRLHGLWSGGDPARVEAVYAPDFVGWWPPSSSQPVRRGRKEILAALGRVRVGFPDWREEVLDIFAAGDRVASRFVATGTHTGPFADLAPTGRRVEIHEIATFRIVEGRVAEQWCAYDEVARLRQLAVGAEHLARIFPVLAS